MKRDNLVHIKYREELENERQEVEAYMSPTKNSGRDSEDSEMEAQNREEGFSVNHTKETEQIEEKKCKEEGEFVKKEE